jgi:hypothetical protein
MGTKCVSVLPSPVLRVRIEEGFLRVALMAGFPSGAKARLGTLFTYAF